MNKARFLAGWGRMLAGAQPMLSIEITRECPLRCPGCYAYGDQHLGGGTTLRALADTSGDALIEGVRRLVDRHRPVHVSIVGGEPLVRHRELSRILPELSCRRIETLVVTSAVIPIPLEWMRLPHVRVAVSVDGLPAEHDPRRRPATYQRILQNISGRRVDISWVITRPQMEQPGYLEQYLEFWTRRPEVQVVWPSIYTPQRNERSAEMLTAPQRRELVSSFPSLKARFPALLMNAGIAEALGSPPRSPEACFFSRVSTCYSADLKTQVTPCFFGGNPDCQQCGCAVTAGLHWIGGTRLVGPLRAAHVLKGSLMIGRLATRLLSRSTLPSKPTVSLDHRRAQSDMGRSDLA